MGEVYCDKCERCHEEGLREEQGEDCPYYGEPNGCNHPQGGYDETQKTWREIVAEMREYCDGKHQPYDTVMQSCADRIEAACKTLEAENAKLRRALEPVMKCKIYRKVFHVNGGHSLEPNFDWMMDAIGKAQAIMKEGAQ